MKKIVIFVILINWLRFDIGFSASDDAIDIKVEKQDSPDNAALLANVHINCSPGVTFTMYLSKVSDGCRVVEAILGSYRIPINFPASGFNFSTLAEIGMMVSANNEKEFVTQYKSNIHSTEELTVYTVATSSSVKRKTIAAIGNITYLERVIGKAFPTVSSVKLTSLAVNIIDEEPFLMEIWIAYAKNIPNDEFLRSVYSGTNWALAGPLEPYPVEFFLNKNDTNDKPGD